MAKATETLKKSRNINISISLDADALVKAMQDSPEEETNEEEATATSLLRQSRDVVKLSQTPMAG